MRLSFRQADILEQALKNRVYNVFFYVWFSTDVKDNLVRDYSGRFNAYLEVFFPDKLTKRDEENNVEIKIRHKVESAIGQPLNQRISSKPDEDISQFYEQIRKNIEPKLKKIDERLIFDSLISHGMKFQMKMKAI